MKIISVISVVFLLFVASQSYARVWYVKQDGTGDAPTIKAAIDSAAANDTVLVAPGTYTQPAFPVVKDSLTVMSEEGAGTTILHTSSSIMMVTAGTCLTIKGFTFEGSADDALGVTDFIMNDDVLIEENTFRSNQGTAVSVISIFPDRIVSNTLSSNIVIRNNLIYSNGGGIHIAQWAGNVEIYQNTISHNAPGAGIQNAEMFCVNPIHHNIISYNGIGVDGFCASDFLCNDIFGNGSNIDPPPFGTNGNIAVDPQFCGVEPQVSGNYYLQSDSPCAPGKHPDEYPCDLIGARPVGCQDTAIEKTSWGKIKSIYR